MDDTALKKYLEVDFAKALKFYDDRASSAKRAYRGFSIYLILASAVLTPLISFAPDELCWRISAATISATLVVATGLMAHLKSHENWLSYRASWDSLERERRYFQTNTGPYAMAPDPSALFVERVEVICNKEGADFFARHAGAEKRDESRSIPGSS